MSRIDPQFNLRIPADLKSRVEEAAKLNKRSATAEIIARLEETFEIEGTFERIAPGASISGTAGLLEDMHNQLEQREDEARFDAMAANAESIESHIKSTDRRMTAIEKSLEKVLGLLQKS
ncbi:Arc-like DNA binding domain-containing protein [Pseudomonas citronellolis]|uniref:Arc-like DNA binding domain-containing protein n=1 Tax=Pseudomonas citronellolis TaxID=53408 RepID=A0AAQ1KFJ7_9PSED|nr:Arc family DNA-binding protein [Pseudomonas citronellolis]TGC30834.1 Arc family DNA-binding protein [Pseudomonas citronellolis]SFC84748.1 Arc-like DNA binding domain-containing protein [Pseudomonas citronellolis]